MPRRQSTIQRNLRALFFAFFSGAGINGITSHASVSENPGMRHSMISLLVAQAASKTRKRSMAY
jgi:hypothetical protein